MTAVKIILAAGGVVLIILFGIWWFFKRPQGNIYEDYVFDDEDAENNNEQMNEFIKHIQDYRAAFLSNVTTFIIHIYGLEQNDVTIKPYASDMNHSVVEIYLPSDIIYTIDADWNADKYIITGQAIIDGDMIIDKSISGRIGRGRLVNYGQVRNLIADVDNKMLCAEKKFYSMFYEDEAFNLVQEMSSLAQIKTAKQRKNMTMTLFDAILEFGGTLEKFKKYDRNAVRTYSKMLGFISSMYYQEFIEYMILRQNGYDYNEVELTKSGDIVDTQTGEVYQNVAELLSLFASEKEK